jgi:hypothetical protein
VEIDQLFAATAEQQYTRELLFSSVMTRSAASGNAGGATALCPGAAFRTTDITDHVLRRERQRRCVHGAAKSAPSGG